MVGGPGMTGAGALRVPPQPCPRRVLPAERPRGRRHGLHRLRLPYPPFIAWEGAPPCLKSPSSPPSIPKPGHTDALIHKMQDNVRNVHDEDGCLHYTYHRGIDNPDALVVVERWASEGSAGRARGGAAHEGVRRNWPPNTAPRRRRWSATGWSTPMATPRNQASSRRLSPARGAASARCDDAALAAGLLALPDSEGVGAGLHGE